MRITRTGPVLLAFVLLITSCTKEIEVELPYTDPQLVVEGTIQEGHPPIVLLSRTQNYFDPLDLNSYSATYVRDADVKVIHGSDTTTLQMYCGSAMSDDQRQYVGELIGMEPDLLRDADVCFYADGTLSLIGEPGQRYDLLIEAEGRTITSTTSLPHAVELDSTWFALSNEHADDDSLGYVWAKLHDPDTLGNGYRVLTRRINHYDDGGVKDNIFVVGLGSIFNDKFFNGLTYDFFVLRGPSPTRDNADNYEEEGRHWKSGDTVVVKFVSMGYPECAFYQSIEANSVGFGDLYTSQSNAKSNISGGLGIWAGWGIALDTVVCP